MSAISEKYASLGGEQGPLGVPLHEERPTADARGMYQTFTGGDGGPASIHWTLENGARVTRGLIRSTWESLRWESGLLGYPISDEEDFTFGGKPGRVVHFERGSLFLCNDPQCVTILVRDADGRLVRKTMQNAADFKTALNATIDAKFAEVMGGKEAGARFLTYADAVVMTAAVRNVFRKRLGVIPAQIEASCQLSEAVLAPTLKEREQLVRTAASIAGGAAGVAMVIGGIGVALGWGAGVVAAVMAFFVGTSLLGPIAIIVAGVTLAAVAGYFAMTGDPAVDTERFMKVLKAALDKAVDSHWSQFGYDMAHHDAEPS